MQAEAGTRTQAGNGRPGRIFGGQARTFCIAAGGTAFGVGQVGIEPVLALCQCLRMRVHGFDARKVMLLAQQVVPDQEAGFADDVQR